MSLRASSIGFLVVAAILAGAVLVATGGDGPGSVTDPASAATVETPSADGAAGAADVEAPREESRAGGALAQPEPSGDRSGQGAGPGASDQRAPAGDPPAERVLRATARSYEGIRSIRADFEQRLRNPLLGRTIRSSGTIYQRQPNRFLMEFTDPAGDLLVSDGEYFWMWYPSVDSAQVVRTARGASGLDLRSQFIGDPVARFEATYQGTEPVRGRSTHVLTLVPREPAGYRRLKVWIDAADHLVRRFELTETSGSVRHFELHDLEINPTLPDELFEFTPPPGARVVTR